jgi:hypothetical protein
MVVTGDGPPKKTPPAPRIFTNTPANLVRSIERMARWTLRKDVSPEQVSKIRAATGLLRVRIEVERVMLDREKFDFEKRIEQRLEAIEDTLHEQKQDSASARR